MTTIRDVAHRAGVSPSTVSAVLNNSKPVSTATRKRVEAAIEEMDYRPNMVARALYTKRTQNLAFLVPSLTNPFFSAVLHSVEAAAHAHEYIVLVCNTEGKPDKARFYLERLGSMGVDGILAVMSWDIATSNLVPRLVQRGIPVVGLAGSRVLPDIHCFVINDIEAGEQAARYLLSLGHRDIAFLGARDSRTTELRYEGLCRVLKSAGVELNEALLVQVDSHEERDALHGVTELLSRNVPFTAAVAFNDALALGVLSAFDDQGFMVPEDLSLMGFDDTISRYARPKISTVASPKHELGVQATNCLLQLIDGDQTPPTVHTLPGHLVIRQSARRVETPQIALHS